LIKENKDKLVEFKEHGGYHLIRNDRNPFANISVETVIANLVAEEERLKESVLGEEEEVFFYMNALDDSEDELSDTEDDDDISEI
jgi:hypothetical protein